MRFHFVMKIEEKFAKFKLETKFCFESAIAINTVFVIYLSSILFCFTTFQEAETFLKHLQIEKTPSVLQAFKNNEQYLWIPSVVMLLIAGRCFLFWCLNVIFFNCVSINGKAIAKNAEKINRTHTTHNYTGSTFSEVCVYGNR